MMKDEEEKRPSKLVSNDFRQTTVLRSNSIVVAVVNNNNNNKTQKMHIFRPLIDNLQSEEIVICDQAQQISHLMSSVILAFQQSTSTLKANIMSLNQKHFVEKRTVKYVMLMNNNNNSNNNNLKSNNNEAQETQISRKLVVVTKQKHRPIVSNSILEPLIKMAMFLISLTCLQLFGVHLERANCQRILRNSHYNNQQPFHPSSANTFASTTTQPQNRIVMNQQQRQTTFDQLLRTAGNNVNNDITLENYNNQFINHQSSNNNNQYHPQVFNQQRPAERRVSGVVQQLAQQPMNINQQQQQQSSVSNNKDTNKMLVCFYTTRQSAPYWPKDSREYVIPADSINSITGATDFTQATFAPILQYEPFNNMKSNANSALVVNNNDGLPQQQQQQSSSDFDVNAQMKNQQQQLVFKSSSMQQQQLPPLQLLGGQLFNSISSNSANNNNGNVANNAKQHQDAISQMLAVAEQQLNLPATAAQQQQQQTLVITSSTTGDNSANKNKQTPTYSFIGDLDATSNNGLIVNTNSNTNGNVGSIAPTLSNTLSQTNNNNNNIANNFVINKDKNAASGVTSSPLKQQQQQQQQLLFSPSLSRAFIVANSLGPTGNGNLNNEVLDTKSQLFVHNSQQAQQQQNNNNNNIQYHQQTAFQQSAEQAATQQKGKSLKSAIGDQVSGANTNANNAVLQFSGSISSASPVPLSSASSSSSPNSALLLQSPSQQPNYRSPIPNFSSTLDSGNQLVINNAANQPGIQTALKSPGAVSFSSNGSGSSAALKLPYAAGLLSNSEAAKVSSSSSSSALPISSQSGSLTLTNGPINSSSSQPLSSSLSSTLVSSPLSTMFDVFGAASQYLMRFKPSSLMSPATLSFNTLSNPDNNRHHHHHHHHQQQQQQTNQQTTNKTLSNSLIPLPFASSLVSSIHKSSSSLTSNNDRSSSQSSQSVGSKILSRFSLQNTQRREDVCGRTIQTPERRIIGGEGAKYGEFPYQVHIKIAKHQCGGALVDRQSIVTAAHCVYHFITRAPVSKLQIVIGAYDIEDEQYQELPPQYFKVNKVKLHPNFRFSASHPDRYDIAILKLDKPVKYTDNVLPVCLPNKDLKFESVVGTVTGFGKTDPSLSNRYGTRLLQKVDVPIIENNECERWHRTRGIDLKIFPEMMCAGYEDGLKDACVGDSGGPLVVKTAVGSDGSFRWTLAGITSAGFGCAQSRQPGIYHRVSHTVDWILENLD